MERVMGANIAADSLSSREKIRWFKDEVQPGDLVSNEKYYYLEMFPGIACQAESCAQRLPNGALRVC
jgi:hypothetical protein